MRHLISSAILIACLSMLSCRGGDAPVASNQTSTPQSNAPQRSVTTGGSNTGAPLGATSAHGGNASTGAGAPSSPDKAPIDTAELDAKIKKAEAKAKASGASAADKKAAAGAYLERGNVYYSANDKRLYKFALGDFRRVLRYEPGNAEAQAKIDQIVAIYESLGRPVPNNGLEP